MLGVALGDDDALVSLEAFDLARLVEALDLLVDTAYRLDLALLINRTSYGKVLLDRKLSQGGENRVQFRACHTVTIDNPIAPIEDESAGRAERLVTLILDLQVTRHDGNPHRGEQSPQSRI